MKRLIPAAAAAAAALVALAETNETESAATELPRVIVEASRTGKTPAEIPAAVQVVSRGEVAASGGDGDARERGAQVRIPVRAPLALQIGVEVYAVRTDCRSPGLSVNESEDIL